MAGNDSTSHVVIGSARAGQHRGHLQWSIQLHCDNLVAVARQDASLGEVPSYGTVRRYMQAYALIRKRPPSKRTTLGAHADG